MTVISYKYYSLIPFGLGEGRFLGASWGLTTKYDIMMNKLIDTQTTIGFEFFSAWTLDDFVSA